MIKILKQKKSQEGLLLFPTLAFILAIILFFLFTAPKIDDHIGGKQAAVIRAVGKGEQELGFVDTSARLAAWQSLFELGEQGGFYSDTGDDYERAPQYYPCDKYGYNLWNSRGGGDCWPTIEKVQDAYKRYFDDNLKIVFFSQHPDKNLKRATYEYKLESTDDNKRTVITGITNDSVPIPIVYEKVIPEKKIISADSIIDTEPRVKCCDGECVVGVAEHYYNKYGPGGVIDLPYVWGGVTPYPIEETKKDQKEKGRNSFFYGVPIHTYQPSGNKRSGRLTVPGFDCSGFVWWVYKHADLKDFEDVKRSSSQLEQFARQKGYVAICSSPATCTKSFFEKSTAQNKAQPGDLIFKYDSNNRDVGHVAVYVGDKQIIDSSGTKDGIDKRPLPNSWYRHITVYRFPYNSGSSCVFGKQEIYEKGREQEQTGTPAAGTEVIGTSVDSGVIPQDAYNRIMRFDDIIQEAAKKNNVPQALIKAVIMQESGGNENSVSPTGCEGIMQFCSAAAQQYNLKNPFDPVASIKAGAKYLHDLLRSFKDYSHKDAFAVASYNVGSGVVKRALEDAKKGIDNKDPGWADVSLYITPELIYDVYCKGGKNIGGYFCSQGSQCINDRCRSKVKEVTNYVNEVLKYYAAFGGGSISAISTYKGVKVSFSPTKIGYYYVTPRFTTEVDYNLGVYEEISAWARLVHERCSGNQNDLSECVDNEVKKQNDAFNSFVKNTEALSPSPINPPFLFRIEENAYCDGEASDYYRFIETFENCLEFGHSNCYCKFPNNLDLYKIRFSNKSIVLYDKDGPIHYYDFTNGKTFNLYHDGQQIDYMTIESTDINYRVEYYKDGSKLGITESKDNLYFVKDNTKIDDSVTNYYELRSCYLEEKKHKFRFCVLTPQEIYSYDKDLGFELENVPIKFALDLYDAPPPQITQDSKEINKPEEMIKEEQENRLSEEKKCKGLGKAEFKIKVTTKDLKPAYENFITSLVTKLVPQLSVLLFAKNFLVTKDSLPALVTVQLDLKGASEDCDIAGLVYKCGVGVAPYRNGKFDFSNPTGYVDISSRFNTQSEFSVLAPNACMLCKNPDGSFTDESVRYMKPQIDGDIISFSVTKCVDPIMQYKKMSGMDILTSALNGFGYYFAFAYVDAAGNYGPATIRTVQIPSVINQLEEQLGIKNWLMIKDVLLGNYDSVFGLLGLDDEWRFIRKALAGASLDNLLINLKGEALNSAYNKIASNIKNEDAKKIFDDLARDRSLDDDYAGKLLEKVKDEINIDEADKIIDKLNLWDLKDSYDYIKHLPLEKKKELLGLVYNKKAEIINMREREVDIRLKRAMLKKDKAVKILKALDPQDKIELVKEFINKKPCEVIRAVASAIGDDKKVEAVKNVLNTVSDAKSGLARMIAYASPDYAKKAALDYITKKVPGFDKYKDLIEIFSGDLEGFEC